MDFGFAFPGRGPLATPEILTKLARKADELRYSSIFVTDHVVIPASQSAPYPYSPTGKFAGDWKNGYLEPLTLMSYLAGETSRVMKIATVAEADKAKGDIEKLVRAWCDWRSKQG